MVVILYKEKKQICDHLLHCAKYYMNLRQQTEPVTVGADTRICLILGQIYTLYVQYVNKSRTLYSCIRSSRDRLGFVRRFKMSFGTVWLVFCFTFVRSYMNIIEEIRGQIIILDRENEATYFCV